MREIRVAGAAGLPVGDGAPGFRTGVLLASAAVLAAAAALSLAPNSIPGAGDGSDAASSPIATYGQLPLAFEPGAGRYGEQVDYVARSAAGDVALGPHGFTFQLASDSAGEAVRLRLPGADLTDPRARERLPGVVNDLRGDDADAWHTGIPTFERVRYGNAYPGVDVDVRGSAGAPRYDFLLDADADPSRIGLEFGGADSIRIASDGDLVVRAGDAVFRQRAPVAYQRLGGERVEVPARFELRGSTAGFELGRYDRSRPLVIDPLVLVYSTFLGGTGFEFVDAVAVDDAGAAYVTGTTGSSDFNTVGPIEGDSVESDVFVSKLNPAGSALVYSTYIGGSAVEGGSGIQVDSAGSAYVTGETQSADFNTVGAIEGDSVGPDVFVAKLNPAGNALVYSTYLGGNAYESPFDLAIDDAGAAYVTGETLSTDFNMVGAIEGDSAIEDVFVSKLDPAGSALVYSTYLGGNNGDGATAIAVDDTGAAHITGATDSTDFDTANPIEGDSPSRDVFVSKLNPAGSALAYSTYLGGSASEISRGIALDGTGAAYIAAETQSTDFDTVAPIEGDSAGEDIVVSKLQPDGSALAYSTYLGGSGEENSGEIAVDSAGAAYVAGETSSADFDTAGELEGDSGQEDAFVTKLAPSGSALEFSTYLGGEGLDSARSVAVDADGSAYVVGDTHSPDFDTVNPIEPYNAGAAQDDGFVAKLDGTAPETTITKAPKKKRKTRKRRLKTKFAFESSEAGSTFVCKLDKKDFAPCVSPRKYRVKKGRHTFLVQATDAAGNTDPTPDRHKFRVKRKRKR